VIEHFTDGCTCDPPSHSGHYSYCPHGKALIDAMDKPRVNPKERLTAMDDMWDLLNARLEPLQAGISFDEGIAFLKFSSQEWREIHPRHYQAYSPGQTTGVASPSYHLVPAMPVITRKDRAHG
jgi:hypothetical protein